MDVSKKIWFLCILLLIMLSGCGSTRNLHTSGGTTKVGDGAPISSKLDINISLVSKEILRSNTSEDEAKIKELYEAMYALPKMSGEGSGSNMICTSEAGLDYELIFSESGQKHLTAKAERYGCKVVTIGKDDKRLSDKAFWSLIEDLTPKHIVPVERFEKLDVYYAQEAKKAKTALLTNTQKIRSLYEAIGKLPNAPQDVVCENEANFGYKLAFIFGKEHIFVNINDKCGTVNVLSDQIYQVAEGVHKGDKAFWDLVEQTMAGEKFEPAQPDGLLLSVVRTKKDGTGTKDGKDIKDTALMQKLYTKLSSLPVAQGPNTCKNEPGTTGYALSFQRGSYTLIGAFLPSFECATINVTAYASATPERVLHLDQETKDLLRQVEKQ